MFVTNQSALLSKNPRAPHGDAIKNLAKTPFRNQKRRKYFRSWKDPKIGGICTFLFLRKLAQTYTSWICHHCKIVYRIWYYAHWMYNYMGYKDTNPDKDKHNWNWVHGIITVITVLYWNWHLLQKYDRVPHKSMFYIINSNHALDIKVFPSLGSTIEIKYQTYLPKCYFRITSCITRISF